MVATVQDTHIQAYNGGFIVLPQQMESRLAEAVRFKPMVRGKACSFHRISPVTQQQYTARHATSPIMDTPFSTRKVKPTNWEYGDMVDRSDVVRMLTDPQSEILQAGQMSLARQKDDWIIAAALGDATVETDAGGEATQALPGSQIDTTAAALTFPRIRAAKKALDAAEVPATDRYFVIGSTQLNDDLLAIPEVTNSDFNPNHVLPNGEVAGKWMGFTWIRSERLATTGSVRHCFCFQKNAMGLGINLAIESFVGQNPERKFNMNIYSETIGGAVRIDDMGVFQVDCTE